MRSMRLIVATLLVGALSSCATNYSYVPIVANAPNMEMTQANCQMLSSSTEQGIVAWGSDSYVAGAHLGNALGNAIRADQFIQQCMAMNGWLRVQNAAQSQPKYTAKGVPYKKGGSFPPAPAKRKDLRTMRTSY